VSDYQISRTLPHQLFFIKKASKQAAAIINSRCAYFAGHPRYHFDNKFDEMSFNDPYQYHPLRPVSDDYKPLEPGDVTLLIRQQPKEGLITTEGKEKSRKPIDPPPVVEIQVSEQRDPKKFYLQSPYLFLVCQLVSAESKIPVKLQGKCALTGALCSSLHRLRDSANTEGGFFVFGDLSAKMAGEYRLQFSLFDARLREPDRKCVFLATTYSAQFKVVQHKDFKGLEESTFLSRAFSDQGVRLRLRKEPRTNMGASKKRSFTDYQEDSQDSGPVEMSRDLSGGHPHGHQQQHQQQQHQASHQPPPSHPSHQAQHQQPQQQQQQQQHHYPVQQAQLYGMPQVNENADQGIYSQGSYGHHYMGDVSGYPPV
jgi:hypothetical protein